MKTTSRKAIPKPDDPAQSKRFIDMAREVETDDAPEKFDRAFKKVVAPRPSPPRGTSSKTKK
jgi:hypothetical protein